MKPNDIVIYLVDNKLIFWTSINKPAIIEKIPNLILKNGKVSKPNEFGEYILNVQKKYQLKKSILNNNIYILYEPGYTKADRKIIYDCVDKLNVNKIEFINITKLLKPDNKTIWIILNQHYLYLIRKDYKNKVTNIFLEYSLFINNLNKIIEHLNQFIKNHQIIIMGTHKDLSLFAEKLELKTHTKVYYIEDFESYLLKSLKNTLDN